MIYCSNNAETVCGNFYVSDWLITCAVTHVGPKKVIQHYKNLSSDFSNKLKTLKGDLD